jgi:methylated-DNA-protein-cysteine methyltransferase-like protein
MATSGLVLRFKSRVLAVIAAIPEGRVTTYGMIARHLKIGPRQVAAVLANLRADESRRLPWFRVVAANGVISTMKLGSVGRRQIKRLRAEGVAVTARNKVEDFRVVAWSPTPVFLTLASPNSRGSRANNPTRKPRGRSPRRPRG